ncbi:MAG: Ig-like domain-containing protein [Acidobacteriota bacterium]
MRNTTIVAVLVASVLIGSGASAVRRRAVRSPGLAPVAPQSVNDSYATARDAALTTPPPGVLGNDTLHGGAIASYGAASGVEQLTVGAATATAHGGTIRLDSSGGFTYTPAGSFVGADEFKYALSNATGSSTATVSINVLPPPPLAANDAFNATQNTALTIAAPGVLSNDTLVAAAIASYGATGSEQTTTGASTPTAKNGTIRLNADGGFTYDVPSATFTGSDSFKYVVTNAGGTATATVTLNVQASGPDFFVTSPGFFFSFSGVSGDNPVLTLTRGRTYKFQVATSSIHPFEILNAPPGSVTNNNISNGTLTFVVPAAAQNYRYHCSIHEFGNNINTTP